MTELKITIAPEKETLLKMLVEELGGEVIESKRNKRGTVNKASGKTAGQPSPTFLFGKWKDLDIDAKKLRAEAWDRGNKFL